MLTMKLCYMFYTTNKVNEFQVKTHSIKTISHHDFLKRMLRHNILEADPIATVKNIL